MAMVVVMRMVGMVMVEGMVVKHLAAGAVIVRVVVGGHRRGC